MAIISIQWDNFTQKIETLAGENLAAAMQRENIQFPFACGGRGTCGQCKVRIAGEWKLACQTYPKEDMTITELGWKAKGDTASEEFYVTEDALTECNITKAATEEMYIAIDIGTTTLAGALVDVKTGRILATVTAMNSQRKYGTDVLSRIKAAVDGAAEQLQQLILEDIRGIREALMGKEKHPVQAIYAAGNTTMEHLLLGYSCKTLGQAPFEPVSLAETKLVLDGVPVVVLPGISAFVGADIAAGMLACGMDVTERTKSADTDATLFLDLGTNGEMALEWKNHIYVTSAPAGPAFEGGNISCGTASIPGAISKVRIVRERAIVSTIAQKKPVGICGTGVLEVVAELLSNRLIDETGRLVADYAKNGFPLGRQEDGSILYFTQQDIRQVQMAKAAIRSGIDILLHTAGIAVHQVAQVYLAGGFGYYLDTDKAVCIGLLPEELQSRTKAVGNTSLQGCITYACEESATERMKQIIEACEDKNLATEAEFEELYVKYMNFDGSSHV